MNNRVVISGIGMATPLGTGKAAFSRRLMEGGSGIAPISAFDTSALASRLGASVADFSPREFISTKNLRKMDRISALAAASARMALDDAGVRIDASSRDRTGIVLGTAFGSTDVAAQFAGVIFTEGPGVASPFLVPNTVMNAPAGHASIELGFRGVNSTVNHREASGETAIAYAAAEILRGRADVMLAGGVDILSEFFFRILTNFKAVSPAGGGPEGARPFDARRNGPVAGEGAGVVCLETRASAEARGVRPYCEIAGWGMSSAPAPPTDWPSDPRGPVLAITRALTSAGIGPGDIDYVSAAANGGSRLDALEAEALSIVFGSNRDKPHIGSIKGAAGESFSSGGIRAAAMAVSIKAGSIPPTVGLDDPIASLNFVRDKKVEVPVAYGLVNGFSSGGTFVSLVLKKLQ
ncbi:MAG: beta-ketoacyl-[acyl-carrier-protein] synthase family protein [Thermodesulfobacteriota bacterium]